MERMRASRALTARDVNALFTSALGRVWSGGSRNSIVNSSGGGSMASCRAVSVPLRGSLAKFRWSRRIASASAWRVNSQAFISRLRCTGSVGAWLHKRDRGSWAMRADSGLYATPLRQRSPATIAWASTDRIASRIELTRAPSPGGRGDRSCAAAIPMLASSAVRPGETTVDHLRTWWRKAWRATAPAAPAGRAGSCPVFRRSA